MVFFFVAVFPHIFHPVNQKSKNQNPKKIKIKVKIKRVGSNVCSHIQFRMTNMSP